MTPVVFDHPVGHRRHHPPMLAHHPRVELGGKIDPANCWQCYCGVISRSWEAADCHTRDEHGRRTA